MEVLEARLRRPASRRGLVVRSELVARLVRAGDVRVVLLRAGAGYGKTTLLTQWAERDSRPFAWVTLDETHDDPEALTGDVGRAVEAVLSPPGGRRPFVLVLDDLHRVRSPRSLALLAALVERLPPGCQLALASRREPALPLARWSVQGDLLLISAGELAMTREEARLVVGAGLDLASGALDDLLRRTEGWAAGLRIAAMRLSERRPAGGAAPDGAHDRILADYVRDEVLAPLEPGTTRLLVDTAMLDRLCGPLCDAVLERDGSAALLRVIERSGSILLPAAGPAGWFRLHPLVRETLLDELLLQGGGRRAELHRRASRWHEARGDVGEAIAHARTAGDLRRAGGLVWANLLPRMSHRDRGTVSRWLEGFDAAEIGAQPTLSLAAAWCGVERADLAAGRRWIAAAERASYDGRLPNGPASPAAAAAILRALAGVDGVRRMAEDAALGQAGDHRGSAWRGVCSLLIGVARRLGGDAEGARASLAAAERAAGVRAGPPWLLLRSLAELAALAADGGDWEAADGLVGRARAVGDARALQRDTGMIDVCAVAALVLARLGQPADVAREGRRCRHLLATTVHVPPWLGIDVRIRLARASLMIGDAASAAELLREGRRLLARMPDAGLLGRWLEEAVRGAEAFPLAGVIAAAPLSRAELRVLRFLPTHLSYREIGGRLHVSPCTVKSQALSAYRKLDVSTRSQAVERASALGLIRRWGGEPPGPA